MRMFAHGVVCAASERDRGKGRGAEGWASCPGSPSPWVILLQSSPKRLPFTSSSAVLMPKSRTFIQFKNQKGYFFDGHL